MKRYMAVFLGSAAAIEKWNRLDEPTRKAREAEGVKAWGSWVVKNQKVVVEGGAPLGKTKKVDEKGVADTVNQLTAWTVVEAESHDAAARLFLGHPHFSIFPGDRIEVMEVLPIPGQG